MAETMAAGGRVVIGTNQALDVGLTVARDGERHLVVKRRATREDFLEAAPIRSVEDAATVNSMRAPFYYELELWDHVISGPAGDLGIRILETRQ
jgi:hypothetical protein